MPIVDCLTLLFSLHIKSLPRVKAFFALTLLVSLIAQTPKGCQVFENKRFQIHFILDTILCLCSHEDKNKKKKFCSQFEQNSFYTQSELTPCPTPPRGVSGGVEGIATLHAFWFFFASRKRTHN